LNYPFFIIQTKGLSQIIRVLHKIIWGAYLGFAAQHCHRKVVHVEIEEKEREFAGANINLIFDSAALTKCYAHSRT